MLSIITNKVERYVISNYKEYQISNTKSFLNYFRAQNFNKFSFSLYNKNI